jgi:hypothetical protein
MYQSSTPVGLQSTRSPDISNKHLLGAGAAFSVISMVWRKLLTVWSAFVSIFIESITVEDGLAIQQFSLTDRK